MVTNINAHLEPPITLIPNFLKQEQADHLFTTFRTELAWKQRSLKIFGKERLEPRLVAWYGDETAVYTYSGRVNIPLPWHPELKTLANDVEALCSSPFNAVLANLYRDGNDSMGWHADDEPELGENPIVASISLGASRDFRMRLRAATDITHSLQLTSGSLLIMKAGMQATWQHCVPKRKRCEQARINLTFRFVQGTPIP